MRRCLVLALVVLAGALLTHAPAALAAPGDLDPTFGSGGEVVTPLDQGGVFDDVAFQPDGKVIAVGYAGISGPHEFLVARYLPDGALDPSFGSGGVVTTGFGADGGEAIGVVLQ